MDAKRIIPCLDIYEGKIVKGVNFINIVEVGDPVALGKYYNSQGADELACLNISATPQGKKKFKTLVKELVNELTIPLIVGGGVYTIDDANKFFDLGVDKISINSAALVNPLLIDKVSKLGTKSLIIAIDASFKDGRWCVFSNGGKENSGRELIEWTKEAASRGANEILFTSIDRDGTGKGYQLDALKQLKSFLKIPLIASGGAGSKEHFAELFLEECADAALAAGVFHKDEIDIKELKDYLISCGIPIINNEI